jgi:hypothetical protein
VLAAKRFGPEAREAEQGEQRDGTIPIDRMKG